MRLSKLMSEKGLSSRREADEWIEHGWVRVDGQIVSELGSRVFPTQVVTIDPAARNQQAQQVTILINKPIGFVSGQAEDGYEPAVVLITAENRWADDKLPIQLTRGHLRHLAPAGRLDIDSTGMLVFTQDGRIAKELIGENSGVEKEYLVRVESMDDPDAENVSAVVPAEAIEALRFGLELDGRQLRPAQVSWQNEQQLRFVLREGRKRQIRRMCEQVGLKVVGLKRVRMGSVTLGKLPLGQWRFLRPDERF
jgi:23S rRNA pseudouridine2604 synthase